MRTATQTTIQCPSCGQPITTSIQTLIDATQDIDAKARLLGGNLNTAHCPNCGHTAALAVPLLYHDASKELLIAYVPMELNLPQGEQEKRIGDLMNDLTRALPKEGFKGYMFNPRRALTLQGLVEQILEADGVTPAMMEAQRERVRLIQTLATTSEEALPALIKENDDKIDSQFLQTMSLIAQQTAQDGRPDMAEHLLRIQQLVVENSTYGQQILEAQAAQEEAVVGVAQAIEALGENASRSDIFELARQYADDEQRLQALVGLARPAFDYTFFQELTAYMDGASAEERESLDKLREQLLELTALVDQQAQFELRQAAGLLQELLNAPNPEELIRESLPLIDSTFMAVLMANIEQAQKQKNTEAVKRLQGILDIVNNLVWESMSPEMRFINELLGTESDAEVDARIAEGIAEFGDQLLEIIDGVEQAITGRDGNETVMKRLAFLRDRVAAALQ